MNILIVGPSWVGDMVMAQTLFVCLKQRHPDCQIDVLAPEWSRPILERMPEVRQALSFPVGHGVLDMATRRKVAQSLRGQYQQAILLPNSPEVGAGAILRRYPQAHGLARRDAFRPAQRHAQARQAALPADDRALHGVGLRAGRRAAQAVSEPLAAHRHRDSRRALARFGLSLDRPVLALCPGAEFGESKRWPAEHFAKVAELKIRDGWQVWLFGSKNDHPVGEQILERLIPGCAKRP